MRAYLTDKYYDFQNKHPISETKGVRIITKAKNDLYYTNKKEPSQISKEGMKDKINSLRNKD